MEDQFVPHKLALKLIELGFDEECLASFIKLSNGDMYLLVGEINSRVINELNNQFKTNKFEVLAPLWQQAFDWLREKYKLVGYIGVDLNGTLQPVRYFFAVQKSNLSKDEDHLSRHGYKTHQEARQACLEELIELCKNN